MRPESPDGGQVNCYPVTCRVFETEDSILLEEEGSSMSTIIERDTTNYRTVANLQFGIPYTYIILAHTWKLPEKKRKFRVALKVNISVVVSNNVVFILVCLLGGDVRSPAGVRL